MQFLLLYQNYIANLNFILLNSKKAHFTNNIKKIFTAPKIKKGIFKC